MATITLKDYNIPVELPNGLSEDQVLNFRPFNVRIPKTLVST